MADRRHLWRALLAALVLVVPFVLLNPSAWLEFVRVPLNLATGDATHRLNLAPSVIVTWYVPALAALAPLLRLATLGLAAGLALLSAMAARRPGGLPAALVTATGAALLGPATIWIHYLPVLIPGTILAFDRGGRMARGALAVGIGLVIASLSVCFPLASLGMLLLVTTPVVVLYPRVASETAVDA